MKREKIKEGKNNKERKKGGKDTVKLKYKKGKNS
jgi:hypothetical protein